MDDLLYSVFGIVVLVLAFFLMKKVASCLIKTIVTVIIAVILGVIYYAYFAA
ncbi:MAG: sulfate transporter [Prevotella sp.]|uniref:sulfate transporter n=1 Tax=Prevotella sp. TaxID=59823 RepID=UPI002A2F6322|nr:sulfate transporter [Prevotella sp.]MDD7318717.1 sulfate transporter [Prevotellaceae bacterium]MDY4019326.1 sulfate transporter [Prevotella sp.]